MDERIPERLALVAIALDAESAPRLLQLFGEPGRARALAAAQRFARLTPEDRRALLALELGIRKDAEGRLRRTLEAASRELKAALYRVLPPYARSFFPELADTLRADRPPPRPTLRAFAKRRAREALL